MCFSSKDAFGKKSKLFCFWFHCSFVAQDRLVLTKPELDKACKDKKHTKYAEDFAVELRFEDLPTQRVGGV